mgnify:CR=1 FL=1
MTLPNFNEYVSAGTPQIKQFDAYASGGAPPFKFNNTYDITASNEANTYNNIYSEFAYLYGSDIIFLPREVNKEETTFGEYLAATIERGFQMRLFIEETQAWSGNGDMYSKFGLQITDECTLYSNKLTFSQATSSDIIPTGLYPKQGDLIYIVKSQKLFQISHIEDEISPTFYLLGNRAGYKIQCRLFTYQHEAISQDPESGIPEAIQALDNLLDNIITPEATAVTLEEKEFVNNNQPIQTSANPIIDTSEQDPLG